MEKVTCACMRTALSISPDGATEGDIGQLTSWRLAGSKTWRAWLYRPVAAHQGMSHHLCVVKVAYRTALQKRPGRGASSTALLAFRPRAGHTGALRSNR